MAFAINTKTTSKLSDSKGNSFLIGTHPYLVKTVSYEVNKQNPSGTEKQVVVDFEKGGLNYRAWFPCESEDNNKSQIAIKGLSSLADACGFKGVLKPENLKKALEGNTVNVEAKENTKNGKTYVNIVDITAASEEEEEEEQEEKEVEAETQEAEEEVEAPKAKGKMPWK